MSDHEITSGGGQGQPDAAAVRTAPPGEVQTALDEAGTHRRSRVELVTETVYQPTETWQIPSGVTLAYNGAAVELQRDVDVHDIAPGACVEQPYVDLRPVFGYGSSVFRFDSARHGFYGSNPAWHVRGGFTRGRSGEGTLYEFAQGGETAIYFVRVDHTVHGIGTVVDMHRGDRYGINGVRVSGVWYDFQTGIRMRNRDAVSGAVDNISGNHFDVVAQPDESDILWDLEVGKFNVLRGRIWDYSEYTDVMWRVHGSGSDKRIGNMLYWFPVGSVEERLVDRIGPRVFDDRLGDPRNRVVVPWLQGRPVGDFSG